jgi:hypothetical protein
MEYTTSPLNTPDFRHLGMFRPRGGLPADRAYRGRASPHFEKLPPPARRTGSLPPAPRSPIPTTPRSVSPLLTGQLNLDRRRTLYLGLTRTASDMA